LFEPRVLVVSYFLGWLVGIGFAIGSVPGRDPAQFVRGAKVVAV
jgi:hypothetical protein